MNKSVTGALVLALPIALSAQATTSGDSPQRQLSDSVVVWTPGAQGASQRLVDGRVLRSLEAHGVYLAALVQVNKKPFAVRLLVRNQGASAFDFIPDSTMLEQVLPTPRLLKYWPPAKVKKNAESYSVAETLLLGLGAFGEGFAAAQGTKTTGSATVSSSGELTRIDYEEATIQPPARSTAETAAALNAEKGLKAASQLRGILLANTLDPGTTVDGVIYFDQPEKKASSLVIKVPVAGRLFVLPLDAPPR